MPNFTIDTQGDFGHTFLLDPPKNCYIAVWKAVEIEPEQIEDFEEQISSQLGHDIMCLGKFYLEKDETGPGGMAMLVMAVPSKHVPSFSTKRFEVFDACSWWGDVLNNHLHSIPHDVLEHFKGVSG